VTKRAHQLPRVTILTASTGGGHRAAARSLAEALEGRAQVSSLSLIDDHLGFPMNTWSVSYAPWVNYTPWLYRLVYRYGNSRERVTATERAVYPLYRRKIISVLAAEGADLFISVHPLHTDVPLWSLAESGMRTPFVTVVTDPVTPPVAWFSPQADLCVVATPPAHATALACGIPANRLRIIGLPTRRAFREARGRSKPDARRTLGLAPDQPLILLSGGGAGIGKLSLLAKAIANEIRRSRPVPQMAVITGHNNEMRKQLGSQRWPLPMQILGFVDNMADWLAAADLLVTKAGPGTLAEAACLGVPSIITDFIPGQEAGNVNWITQHQAGLFERDPQRIASRIASLLDPASGELTLMSQRAYAMARPEAADEIAAEALALLS
jgi:1,2-diacylglycerol 3-beta-galactosyltransferase